MGTRNMDSKVYLNRVSLCPKDASAAAVSLITDTQYPSPNQSLDAHIKSLGLQDLGQIGANNRRHQGYQGDIKDFLGIKDMSKKIIDNSNVTEPQPKQKNPVTIDLTSMTNMINEITPIISQVMESYVIPKGMDTILQALNVPPELMRDRRVQKIIFYIQFGFPQDMSWEELSDDVHMFLNMINSA